MIDDEGEDCLEVVLRNVFGLDSTAGVPVFLRLFLRRGVYRIIVRLIPVWAETFRKGQAVLVLLKEVVLILLLLTHK